MCSWPARLGSAAARRSTRSCGAHSVAEGTSAAAPSVAAIIAILDQGMSTPASPDGRQGLINPLLYSLAAAEYGSPQSANNAASACSASLGSSIVAMIRVFSTVIVRAYGPSQPQY